MEAIMAQQQHISTKRARAGQTPHIVRYVLGVSLVLAIVAMIVVVGFR
jgi:hypothetical protein